MKEQPLSNTLFPLLSLINRFYNDLRS